MQAILITLCTLSCVLSVTDDEVQYCSPRYGHLCKGKGIHVGCQFIADSPGEACENFTRIPFNKELRHIVTHYINRRRQKIAAGRERVRGGALLPQPEVMMMVEWDRELATLAQRLADQCLFVHDDCRATLRYPHPGQAVGELRWRRRPAAPAASEPAPAVRRVLAAWWGERRRVEPAQLTEPFRVRSRGLVWGHFSQLAVYTLRAVGCGASQHGSDKTRLLLVCDFSHTNMLGVPTLRAGPLKACPAGSVRTGMYNLLCATIHPKEPESDADAEIDDEDEEYYDYVTSKPTPSWTENKMARHRWSTVTTPSWFEDLRDNRLVSTNQHGGKLTTVWDIKERKTQADRDINSETDTEVLRMWAKQDKLEEPDAHVIQTHRNRPTMVLKEESEINSAKPIRRKWQQTRSRPRRPGADNLHRGSTFIRPTLPRRVVKIALNLDKEDVDQLFMDTGFRLKWRETKPL